jgi:hypothetical protein
VLQGWIGGAVIGRFSSRRQRLDQSFLNERLKGAKSYDRIAGFFSSSILEVAGEALESIEGPIRLVCNSELDARDVATAKLAQLAMRRAWCDSRPEGLAESGKDRSAAIRVSLFAEAAGKGLAG